MRHTLGNKSGFTLVELLVVISIIAVLIAILLPALGMARQWSATTQCEAQLRSLGQCISYYNTDFKTCFPRPTEGFPIGSGSQNTDLSAVDIGTALWFNAMDHYLGLPENFTGGYSQALPNNRNDSSLKQDPQAWAVSVAQNQIGANQGDRSLKMNSNFCVNSASQPSSRKAFYRETELTNLSKTVLLGDGQATDATNNPSSSNNTQFGMTESMVGIRHPNQSANMCFVDGHAVNAVQPVRNSTTSPSSTYPSWFADTDPTRQIYKFSLP